ncbi:MAG TPA: YciI family protein, partial [Myxococcota bacterium]|nr:YciI family protein [Myxococcota bacterium]
SDPAPEGKRYLFLFLMDADDDGDPDNSKFETMDRWILDLEAQKKHVQCARLDDAGKRIEVHGGVPQVLDGPFAESKEVVGGYSILLARGRDEALALARGCPHARWGTVEVREIMNVPGPG